LKTKKTANIIFLSVFLAFILIISAVIIIKPKLQTSYYENRALAQIPPMDYKSMTANNYFNRWERFFSDQAAGRQSLVRLATAIDLNVIHRPVVNDVVVSDGVFLRFNEFDPVDEEKVRAQSKDVVTELSAFRDIISSYGGEFYYAAVPAHYTWFADKYPWYLNNRSDYTDACLKAFTSDMSEAGINLIMPDFSPQSAATAGRALYSPTDHHFTFYGAYDTYRSIIERINSDGKYTLPMLTEGVNFEFKTLPNPYMGSRMRMLMNVPGITEHTAIAVLDKDIPFTRSDNGVAQKKPSVYYMPVNEREVISYGIYMGGDVAETVVDTGRELPSILVYGESFTNAVECLMYTSAGVMRSVDLRYYKDMPLSEYVEKYKPDIVICIRGYDALVLNTDNGNVMGN